MTILLTEAYNIVHRNRGAAQDGWVRPTLAELFVTDKNFEQVASGIRVGPGQAYSTINDGIGAGEPGDIIQIYPGTYNETIVLDKAVHLKGITTDPSLNEIKVYGIVTPETDNTRMSAFVAKIPSYTSRIYVEGLSLYDVSDGEWTKVAFTDAATNQCNYEFNRCSFYSEPSGTSYPFMHTPTANNVNLRNCYLEMGYAHVVDCVSSTSLFKCTHNGTWKAYRGSTLGSTDTVEIPTVGYGPSYGTFVN